MPLKLKLDDAGHVVIADGKPVYVHDDGKEIPFDAEQSLSTISRLNGEAKGHREAKEAVENKLKLFDGIEDPVAAKSALDVVKNLDAKKLVDAGEVERVKAEAVKVYEDKLKAVEMQIKPLQQERDGFLTELHAEKVSNAFANSPFIKEKVAIPPDFVKSGFGKNFKVEEGKIIGYKGGEKLFSRRNPGEIASFDEALELLIDTHPSKDDILKGSGASGGGSRGGTGQGGKRVMTRAEFSKLDPANAAKTAAQVGKGEIQLVD